MGHSPPKILTTLHARERMKLRSISKEDVLLTIKNPDIERNAGVGCIEATKKFDTGRVLKKEVRVIWKKENNNKVIITVFCKYLSTQKYGKISNKIR